MPHMLHGAGIYANIWGILMGSMLPYMAAPWILWVINSLCPRHQNHWMIVPPHCLRTPELPSSLPVAISRGFFMGDRWRKLETWDR